MIDRGLGFLGRLLQRTPGARLPAVASRLRAVLIGLLLLLLASGPSTARDPDPSPLSVTSRHIQFTHLTQRDGLSQNSVNAIAQDQTGYIWIGTQEGLNRYNGHEFSVYEPVSDDPQSLSNGWVWAIFVDRSGAVWIGTDGGGLNRYDAATDSFEHFRHDPNDPHSLSSDRIRAIAQDRGGALWVGTDGGGLNRLDASRSRFTRFQHDPTDPGGLPSNQVLSLHEDDQGAIWVGTVADGIAILDPASATFRFLRHDANAPGSLSSDRVRSIFQDQRRQIWVGASDGGLNRFDPATQTFQHFRHDPNDPHSIGDDRILDLFEDRQGTLWIATDSGLCEWRPAANQFVTYRHDAAEHGSLSNNRVTTIMQDRGGVLWLGTYGGISKWNYVSDMFQYAPIDPAMPGSLSGKVISAIAEAPNGDLWVGTYGQGLNRIDGKTGRISRFPHGEDHPHALSDPRIMALWVDPSGMVWVGTRNRGLNKLDPRTGEIQRFAHDPADPHSLGANGVTSLLGDPDGTLWVGTYGGGLHRLESGTDRFHRYRHQPDDPSSLSSDRVLIIVRESNGDLWVGTEDGGLNRLDESTGSFVHYRHDPDDATSLSSDSAWELTETRDGAFWIGTAGGGLNRWDRADRRAGRPRFTRYAKADGLISDTIHGILEAADGALWLSSNRGLTRFTPNQQTHQHFDQWNGLRGSEFNHGARLLDRHGVMYFGGIEGLVSFHPTRFEINQYAPTMVVTARDQLRTLGSGASSNPSSIPILLNYRSNFVAFDFAALAYAAPAKNQYRYRLDGLDQEWINAKGYRRATYSNLPPGDYLFQVKGSNSDGLWSEQPAQLAVRVVPPPWRTIHAYILYGLIVLAIIGSFFHREHRKLFLETQQRIRMEREVAVRTQEIAERNAELRQAIRELEAASLTDSLTGLKNRRFLYDCIEKMIDEIEVTKAITHSYHQQPTAIDPSSFGVFFLMIDLDGFKAINDRHGHHSGDRALLQVCDILRSCCGKSEHIVRWGGDEFLIVGRQHSRQGTEKLAEHIRERLADHLYQLGDGQIGRLSGSIGFALYPFIPADPEALTWEQVIGIADHASYIAKNTHRNAWVGLHSTLETVPDGLATRIKSDLEQLIARSQIRITTSIGGRLLLQDRRKKEEISG